MTTRCYLALLAGTILVLNAVPGISAPDDLVGIWVLEKNTDEGIQIFTRAASLTGNRPGLAFSPHGGLVVRQAGWPGAPSPHWSNRVGLWRQPEETLLEISHAWRNGPRKYQLEIIALTTRRLICRVKTGPGS